MKRDRKWAFVRTAIFLLLMQLTAGMTGGKLSLTWGTNIVCHLESATNVSPVSNWTAVTGASPPFSATPLSTVSFYRLASP